MAQLVIDPDADEGYQVAASELGKQLMGKMRYPVRVILRARLLRMLHPYVHHFVIWKTFDATSKLLVDTGMVCAYCGLGELS
jgi:hypothetical protein